VPDFLSNLVERRNTKAYIDRAPVVITLIPQDVERTRNGGMGRVDLPPRSPQRFTLVPQGIGTVSQIGVQPTTDGSQLLTQYVLVGMPDAVLGRYDYWIQDGLKHEITYVYPENGYERRALVVRHGS
jgi:hypothetical protein